MADFFYDYHIKQSYIKVDPSFHRKAPLEAQPFLVVCGIPVKHLKDEKSDKAVTKLADDFEREAAALVAQGTKSSYVGRVLTASKLEFGFYSSYGTALIKQFRTSRTLTQIAKIDCFAKHDPQWSVYRYVLFPSPLRQSRLETDRVVANLKRAGDDGFEERKIEHSFYFLDPYSRRVFSDDVVNKGYSVKNAPAAADEYGKWPLVITAKQRPVLMAPTSYGLINEATKYQAKYDGWHCEVVLPDEASAAQ